MPTAERLHRTVVGQNPAEERLRGTAVRYLLADDMQTKRLPGNQAPDGDRVAIEGTVAVSGDQDVECPGIVGVQKPTWQSVSTSITIPSCSPFRSKSHAGARRELASGEVIALDTSERIDKWLQVSCRLA